MRVAQVAVPHVPLEVVNAKTTGTHPNGSTCLHLCCDGSDVGLQRASLCRQLCELRADTEARTPTGATPVLLAGGVGLIDAVEVLRDGRHGQ